MSKTVNITDRRDLMHETNYVNTKERKFTQLKEIKKLLYKQRLKRKYELE